ncbi:MAG: hypothetical protein ACLFSQ_04475 [Candidatus Zixiibacteriota bacterium]
MQRLILLALLVMIVSVSYAVTTEAGLLFGSDCYCPNATANCDCHYRFEPCDYPIIDDFFDAFRQSSSFDHEDQDNIYLKATISFKDGNGIPYYKATPNGTKLIAINKAEKEKWFNENCN